MSAPARLPGPLPFGATIGIVGGGQLGRMIAMAAARLGLRTAILDPDPDCPAAQVANRTLSARYEDSRALAELAKMSAAITYEFENVPVEPMRRVAALVPVSPSPDALAVAQDRVAEKAFLNGIGLATAPWRRVDDAQELDHALLDLGGDCILKTRRLGYDGKGQAVIRPNSPHGEAFAALGGVPAILEKRIGFEREISVIAARGLDGSIGCYDPAENVHGLGILKSSTVPARIDPATAEAARAAARTILERLDYVGVIGVEFFAERGGRLLVNEIAPRVHNSGHWTEAACLVSQFEQHVRAVAGWPLGSTRRHLDARMENLLGNDVLKAGEILREANAVLHLYGKAEARPGRKMGHVTRVRARSDESGDEARPTAGD